MLPLIARYPNDFALDQACDTEALMQHPFDQPEETDVFLSPRSGSRQGKVSFHDLLPEESMAHVHKDAESIFPAGSPIGEETSMVVYEAPNSVPGIPASGSAPCRMSLHHAQGGSWNQTHLR